MTETLREIAFDTETTGLEVEQGHRVIELGAVELINHVATGKTFRAFVNPGRPVSDKTVEITGITDAMLVDKPPFEDPRILDALLEFIGDASIVAHNAKFDRRFLNMELERAGQAPIPEARWIDTLAMARKRHPGAPLNLDALCRRYGISLESRTLHGALLDAQLLSDVYLELLGGRARRFIFDDAGTEDPSGQTHQPARGRCEPLPSRISEAERARHATFLESLGSPPVWHRLTGHTKN
jgi:DNA polymerase III subunit epsilon